MLFSRLLAVSLFAAGTLCEASAAQRLPRALIRAVPALRGVVFPVLIPTTFADVADLEHDRLYVPVTATPHHYHLEIDFAPNCQGANVCSAGSFDGFDSVYRRTNPSDAPPAQPRRPDADDRQAIRDGSLTLDRPTALAGGRTGYYTESHSAADDGGNSTLRWADGEIEYTITTRISNRSTLVRIANSALVNGPVFKPQ